MTAKEAHQKIADAFPQSSHCIDVASWRHLRSDGTFGESVEYRISVLPGRGEDCSQWTGKSLAEAVALMLAPSAHPPATAEDVEAHVAELAPHGPTCMCFTCLPHPKTEAVEPEDAIEEARRNPGEVL